MFKSVWEDTRFKEKLNWHSAQSLGSGEGVRGVCLSLKKKKRNVYPALIQIVAVATFVFVSLIIVRKSLLCRTAGTLWLLVCLLGWFDCRHRWKWKFWTACGWEFICLSERNKQPVQVFLFVFLLVLLSHHVSFLLALPPRLVNNVLASAADRLLEKHFNTHTHCTL